MWRFDFVLSFVFALDSNPDDEPVEGLLFSCCHVPNDALRLWQLGPGYGHGHEQVLDFLNPPQQLDPYPTCEERKRAEEFTRSTS